jgi:hypothetical protein
MPFFARFTRRTHSRNSGRARVHVPAAALLVAAALLIAAAGRPAAAQATLPATLPALTATPSAPTTPGRPEDEGPALSRTPSPSPTPARTRPPACPDAPPTRLRTGERGRVSIDDPRPLNVRTEPGTGADTRAQIEAGQLFFVLEGPECSGGRAWFRISYREDDAPPPTGTADATTPEADDRDDETGTRITGWIAEGEDDGYFVEPYPPGG